MKKMCAKCGGSMKKYQKGGSTMKTTVGSKGTKPVIGGIPNSGPTGPNYQGVDTMKRGGMVKKYQKGGGIDDPKDPKKTTALQSPTQQLGAMSGKDYRTIKKGVKREQKLARIGSGKQGERLDNLIQTGAGIAESAANITQSIADMKKAKGQTEKKFQKGGTTSFGRLSVKAGIDKNPRPTAADRIAGAKMAKKKMGGTIRKKK